jgi:hypothetical protein
VIAPLPVLAGVCKHARPSRSGHPLLCVLGLLCRGLLLRSVPGRILVVRVQRGPTENPPGANNDGLEIPHRGRGCLVVPNSSIHNLGTWFFSIRLANNMPPSRTHETTPHLPVGRSRTCPCSRFQTGSGRSASHGARLDRLGPGQPRLGHASFFQLG